MNQPRQFHLIPGEVLAIQRNGTPHRDLEIAEWMERSQPYGEYRATTGAFVVITPTVRTYRLDLMIGSSASRTVASCPARTGSSPHSLSLQPRRHRSRPCAQSAATLSHPPSSIPSLQVPSSARTACSSTNSSSRSQICQRNWTETLFADRRKHGHDHPLVYPPLHENMTASEHRQATVRWARRALRPDAAVIIGLGTTAPGSGSLIEIAVIEADRTIRLNTLVNPRTPINPVTRRDTTSPTTCSPAHPPLVRS